MKYAVFAVLLCCLQAASRADEFIWAFYLSPPYSDQGAAGEPIGMNRELVDRLSVQTGISFRPLMCPFARCMALMEEGEADFIVGLVRTAARERHLAYVEPAYYSIAPTYAFYKRQDSDFSLKSYDDLSRYTIAVTRGGAYFMRFDNDSKLRKVEVLSIDKQLQLLAAGRVDLVIGVESTMDHTIDTEGYSGQFDKVEFHAVTPISGYMAVSRKSPLVSKLPQLSDGVKAMKKDGSLGEILGKYGINDISASD